MLCITCHTQQVECHGTEAAVLPGGTGGTNGELAKCLTNICSGWGQPQPGKARGPAAAGPGERTRGSGAGPGEGTRGGAAGPGERSRGAAGGPAPCRARGVTPSPLRGPAPLPALPRQRLRAALAPPPARERCPRRDEPPAALASPGALSRTSPGCVPPAGPLPAWLCRAGLCRTGQCRQAGADPPASPGLCWGSRDVLPAAPLPLAPFPRRSLPRLV